MKVMIQWQFKSHTYEERVRQFPVFVGFVVPACCVRRRSGWWCKSSRLSFDVTANRVHRCHIDSRPATSSNGVPFTRIEIQAARRVMCDQLYLNSEQALAGWLSG